MSERERGQVLWSGTLRFKAYRAPIRRRIAFVWRWRREIGVRHALYILRHGIGGVTVQRGDSYGTFYVRATTTRTFDH